MEHRAGLVDLHVDINRLWPDNGGLFVVAHLPSTSYI
jgi:hypothetical protein